MTQFGEYACVVEVVYNYEEKHVNSEESVSS